MSNTTGKGHDQSPVGTSNLRRRTLLVGSAAAAAWLGTGGAGTGHAAETQPTVDGWELVHGPGWIVPTNRTYKGEPALRVDYNYWDMSQHGDVLIWRQVPENDRDWSGYSGLTFALDGERSSYAVQIQLVGAGGHVTLQARISLDTKGWNEVYVPFHRFTSILGTTAFDWSQVTGERLVIRYQGGDFDRHTVYLGGWERTRHSTPRLPDPTGVATSTVSVPVGDAITAEFVIGDDDDLLYGLAGVSHHDTLLRSQDKARLIHPVVYDRDGVNREAFRYQGIEERADSATITAVSVDGEVTLRWTFESADDSFDGTRFTGVGYRYEVSSTVPIDQIDEHTTWELGGTSVGNTAVLRSSAWATEVDGDEEAGFDTRQGDPPRFAHAAAFEYQAGELGQLIITYDRVDAITMDFVKHPGGTVFKYRDTYFLSQRATTATPTKLVLHATGPVAAGVELINAHTRVQDSLHERLRKKYGVKQPRIEPTVTIGDGRAPLDDYTDNGWLAEAAELGFKRVHLGSIWNSDTENGGPSSAIGIAVWTFDVGEPHGGNDALRRLTRNAGDEGLAIGMWAPAAHMSRNAPIIDDNPSWVAMGPYGAPESTYWSLAGFDLHDGDARQHLFDSLTERHTADGLAGLWLDSAHGHGFAQYDHANAVVRPHAQAMAEHIGELQNADFIVYTEARGPFGVPSSGYNEDRIQYYQGYEYRAYETSMNFTVTSDEIDFYRFAANKALPFNSWIKEGTFWDELQDDADLRSKVQHANSDYNAVVRHMGKRTLLHDDHGVEWESAQVGRTVLFSYDRFDYRLSYEDPEIEDVTTGEPVTPDGRILHTEGRHTYLIKKS